jgi:hypothetical protein
MVALCELNLFLKRLFWKPSTFIVIFVNEFKARTVETLKNSVKVRISEKTKNDDVITEFDKLSTLLLRSKKIFHVLNFLMYTK